MIKNIEARLKEHGIDLPTPASPVANYVPYHRDGQTLYISGQIARQSDGSILSGKLGENVSIAEGQAAARLCAVHILAQAKAALGDLERIDQVLRLNGFVNATPDFADHPQVINGASDLMVQLLEDRGRHTRIAVGVSGLPSHSSVEIDAIIRFKL